MARIKIEGLKTNTSYKFYIVARDDHGTESAPSNIYTFITDFDTTAPNMISNLGTDFSTSTFTASWTGPDTSDTPDFRDYKITIAKPAGVSYQEFYTTNKSFSFTLEENRSFFGATTPSASINISVASRDTTGNISSSNATIGVNAAPDDYPTLNVSPISGGFSASWSAPAASFTDYAYSEMYLSGIKIWQGTNTYAEYSNFGTYSSVSVTVRHFDIFNQAGPSSSVVTVTPTAPLVVDTNAPSNATGLTITAANSGGATGMSGYIIARWNESIDTSLRGARLRIRAQGDSFYQYENLAASYSQTGSYQINNLIPGFVYEVAIASYDEINNTSSFTNSSPQTILIPYATAPAISPAASSVLNQKLIATNTTISASHIGMVVSGYGIPPGTRIVSASSTSSIVVSNPTASTFSGSTVSFYPGVANWQSYITAGIDDGTGVIGSSSYMKFGTGITGTQHGIWLNNNNYWYTTGNLKVGSDTSYFGWDGTTASITGDLQARSGSFIGNVKIAAAGSLYGGNNPESGARVIFSSSGLIGYNSAGVNTFVINAATGDIAALAGNIGGWKLETNSLTNSASTVGLLAPTSPVSSDIAFFAGTSGTPKTASFRVTYGGNASLSNALLSGSVVANSGSIGGWVITSSGLFSTLSSLSTIPTASLVNPSITASNTLFSLNDTIYLSTEPSLGKPAIYINDVTDNKNYGTIYLNSGGGQGTIDLYRRTLATDKSLTATSIKYDSTNSTASIFYSSAPTANKPTVGTSFLLTQLPQATTFTFSASNSINYATTAASFNAFSASWPAAGSSVYSGDFVLSANITGSATTISNISYIPIFNSGSLTSEYYIGTLSSSAATGVATASFLSPTIFRVSGAGLSFINSTSAIGDYVSNTASSQRSLIASFTSQPNASYVVLSPAPNSSALSGSVTFTVRPNPNFYDFNSFNTNSGSIYYSVTEISEGVSSSYITFTRIPLTAKGQVIYSGSSTLGTGSISATKDFSGKITTDPLYSQDGHTLSFIHDKGAGSSSSGWPSRSDLATGVAVTRSAQPNISTRSVNGSIEINGSAMSDGISKLILGDGLNSLGAQLSSYYDSTINSTNATINLYGVRSEYSSFWTGSSVKAGRAGMQFVTFGGYKPLNTTSSVGTGTSGNKFFTIQNSSSTAFVVGQEIINTTNTAASAFGSLNQIESVVSGTGGVTGTASVFVSYPLSATTPAGASVSLYTPDRRKMEFNSSGNIYMQSDEDITLQATRFFSGINATLSLVRNTATVYTDGAKLQFGSGFFRSGVDIEGQSNWVNSASPFIAFTPFDNFGSRATQNALSYNHAEQSWIVGSKNVAGNGIRFKVESTGIGAGNSGIVIGRNDGTSNLAYIDFRTSGGTTNNRTARIIASKGSTTAESGQLSLNAASLLLNGSIYETIALAGTTSSIVVTNGTFRIDFSSTPYTPFAIINGASGTAEVRSQAIYGQITATAANMLIAGVGNNFGIFRSTSKYEVKNNISSLYDSSSLSSKVPINKIIKSGKIDPFKVLNVTPVSFNSLIDTDPDSTYLGFIAEDIADKFPEISTYDNGKVEYYNLNGMVAAMLAVIQRQEQTINNLESRLSMLENK